jgi:DNA (cytosine-5)-methyltransferase 1
VDVRRPRAIDLFCGDGGATRGLQLAGFHVTGVDRVPRKRYVGDLFYQADALEFDLRGFDFIWASPPCQAFTSLKRLPHVRDREHPNLIPETRARLIASGIAYCIENVEGAPLGESGWLIMLCGTMFGLQTADGCAYLRRHRIFETSFPIVLRPACNHASHFVIPVRGHTPVNARTTNRAIARQAIMVSGNGSPQGGRHMERRRARAVSITGNTAQTNTKRNYIRDVFSVKEARHAMGIDWMPMSTLSQAVPPAYAEFVGRQALGFVRGTA